MTKSPPAFCLIDPLGDTGKDKLVCIEDYVVGLEMEDWKVGFGHSVAATWPKDAIVKLRKTSGRQLTDLLGTIKNTLFVSPRLRAVIADHVAADRIEFLPFALLDHRDRSVASDYAIANPLDTLDCLDLDASEVVRDRRDAKKILMVHAMVLSAKKVAKAPALFRALEKPASYIASCDLLGAIRAARCTNVVAQPLVVQ